MKHLLDLDFPVSGKASDTTSVNAYTTATKCAERSVGDLKLTLVDTPGMNDTRGLNQDACNFHAIKTFCRENIQIDDKIMFPNIVLLCVPSTDKRIDGPESTFTKNLRTLKSLQVIDTDRPNLVIAVTHACALPNKKKSKWEEKKKSITENYQNIVRVSLGFEVPVVFLENEYEEEELKEDAEKRGTFLPDGEIQPVNLFKTLTEKARENEDEIALMVLREAYRDGAKGKLSANRSTPATVAEPDGSNLNEEEKTCKELLLSSSAIHQELQKTNEQVIALHLICRNQISLHFCFVKLHQVLDTSFHFACKGIIFETTFRTALKLGHERQSKRCDMMYRKCREQNSTEIVIRWTFARTELEIAKRGYFVWYK